MTNRFLSKSEAMLADEAEAGAKAWRAEIARPRFSLRNLLRPFR